jgi:spore coat protein U-like protein
LKIYLSLAILLFLCCVLVAGESHAACSVTTTATNFGSYNPLLTSPVDSTGSISVDCTGNAHVTIFIGVSGNSGSFNPRSLKRISGTDLLSYNLYTTAARTSIWGDETQGTASVPNSVKKNKTWTATVYGRISGDQDVPVGTYSDSLVVTINY